MSSYIVSNRTIQAIVTTFARKLPGNPYSADLQKLGQLLIEMNFSAYNDRYPNDKSVGLETYQHSHLTLSDLSAYKIVSAYLYQCSEGDVPETDLYKAVAYLKSILADAIISRIDGFDDLPRDL